MITRAIRSLVLASSLTLTSLSVGTSAVIANPENTRYAVTTQMPSHQEIEQLGQQWATALASRDVSQITALYDPEAVLLATFTSELDAPEEIQTYFSELLQKPDLQVAFDTQNLRILDENSATNSGLYTFSFTEAGETVQVPARYTFVYEKRGDRWVIIEHHSSIRPEES
jgi:uncharacterized protein (TIGR02246 family)